MRIVHGALVMSLSLLVGAAGSAATILNEGEASAAQRRGASTVPFRALDEGDLTSSRETGCTCTFDSGNSTLVQAIGNELMVRTAAGRQVCRITDAQFQTLSGGRGTAACGGVQMSFRRTGPSTSSPETDSFSAPTALTARHGRSRRTLNGTWGCAC